MTFDSFTLLLQTPGQNIFLVLFLCRKRNIGRAPTNSRSLFQDIRKSNSLHAKATSEVAHLLNYRSEIAVAPFGRRDAVTSVQAISGLQVTLRSTGNDSRKLDHGLLKSDE